MGNDGEPASVPQTVDSALGRLAEASLIAFSDDEQDPAVLVNRLVMRIVRDRSAQDGTMAGAGTTACAVLGAAIGSLGDPWRQRAAAHNLVRQAVALNGNLPVYLEHGGLPLAKARLAVGAWAGWCLNVLGDIPAQAAETGESVLADSMRVLGPDDPDTLTSQSNLAQAYLAAGRVDDALALNEQVLLGRMRILGPDHPDILTSQSNLAQAYLAAGRVDDALALNEQVLLGRMRILGPDHPDILTSQSNLAQAYLAAGRVDNALALNEQVLLGRMRILGPDHPDTLTSQSNLATVYRDMGQLDKALPLYEEAVAGLDRILGPDHPATVAVRRNLARCLGR